MHGNSFATTCAPPIVETPTLRLTATDGKSHPTAREIAQFFGKVIARRDGCWVWVAGTCNGGYGAFNHRGKSVKAHRFAYAFCVGPIPAGLTLDHLCLNPLCVNPLHLEPVTNSENSKRARWRGGVCRHGHAMTGLNILPVVVRGRATRICRTCKHLSTIRSNKKMALLRKQQRQQQQYAQARLSHVVSEH